MIGKTTNQRAWFLVLPVVVLVWAAARAARAARAAQTDAPPSSA